MRTHYSVVLALCLCLSTLAGLPAQSGPYDQGDTEFARTFGVPTFLYDIYAFKSERAERSELRVYLAFVNDILQFARDAEEVFRARYEIAVDVLDLHGVRQDGEIVTKSVVAQRFEETNSRTIANQHQFEFDLRPGTYDVVLEITDQATKRRLKRKKRFQLRAFRERSVEVSDVLFVNGREKGGGAFPNLHKTFEDPQDVFDALFEIYGAGTSPVQLQITIVNTNNDIVFEHQTEIKGDEDPLLQRIPLRESLQKAGLYRLTVELEVQGDLLLVEEVFLSQYSNVPSLSVDGAPSNQLLQALQYVASAEDYSVITSAEGREQTDLVDTFWKQRDPTPMTPENELRGEFERRVRFAMRHLAFSSNDRQGWETDRGRIYITYGPPTDLRRRSMDSDSNPYETWYYGQVDRRFVFMDKSGNGDFKLVHKD